MAQCKLMKYFKALDKKAKIALVVIKKVYHEFPETQTFCQKCGFMPNQNFWQKCERDYANKVFHEVICAPQFLHALAELDK